MAILGRITVEGLEILNVDTNPSGGAGTPAPLGSLAINSVTAVSYQKVGVTDTAWVAAAPLINTFIFQPGGVGANNVFNDWGLLMDAVDATAGPRIIEFDDSIVSPCVIPDPATTGRTSYDMRSVLLKGFPGYGFGQTSVTIAGSTTAAVFTNLQEMKDMSISFNSPNPAILVNGTATKIRISGVDITCLGAAPFIDAGNINNSNVELVMDEGSRLNPGGGTPVISMDNGFFVGSILDIRMKGGSAVTSIDTVRGGFATLWVLTAVGSAIDFTDPGATAIWSGILTFTNLGRAEWINYDNSRQAPQLPDPPVGRVWGSNYSVQDALDAIKVRTLSQMSLIPQDSPYAIAPPPAGAAAFDPVGPSGADPTPVWSFPAGVDRFVDFFFVTPIQWRSPTSGMAVRIGHASDDNSGGAVRWQVEFMRYDGGLPPTDTSTLAFDTPTASTSTVPAVADEYERAVLTVAGGVSGDLDDITAQDLMRLRVTRVGSDPSDTNTGNMYLFDILLQEDP